jgi:quercetin dioxygenase-like cupin family protein
VELTRGRLLDPADAPAAGERFEPLAAMQGVRVEQILSPASTMPARYEQAHDEWVAVLAGSATLDVAGETVQLEPGDWVLLPAGVPHTVVTTAAGTSWLAVHAPPAELAAGR